MKPTFDQNPREYIGQEEVKSNLRYLSRQPKTGEKHDHALFCGPRDWAKPLGLHHRFGTAGYIKATSGPVIERPGDLAAILSNLQEHDILFIDEIHRLNHVVEEILYPAMEDFQIDVLIGKVPVPAPLN